ncbi:PREDICTED: uncharacterized protein LOC104590427 isoform X2 [Nelumbo nucifera]|uniref:Uncharacterized protein LOC104590427 isoform X2 n=1 Tax=Nelumbo nucifera TaxID=4432 RepID=A0A1U7ZGW2_NELNU|nr:PREDICTED: uncharacterized protein LOC104590427 isoform X2 [Nelumbo nucifera]
MRARLIVFPIKGRNWCFSRSIDTSVSELGYSRTSPTLKDLCKEISSNGKSMNENAELVVDFVSDKMNRAWIGLEKAPEGTFKKKIYGLGLHLLARVKPSEIFLKSISKEVTEVEVTFPKSLNSRLVRRRLRHTALRGTIIHRKYFYGSVSLLPFTMAFTVLPLPNIPFFWILFRSYSHWRALKVLNPCEELGKLLGQGAGYGVSRRVITDICKAYHLDTKEVLKYHNSV